MNATASAVTAALNGGALVGQAVVTLVTGKIIEQASGAAAQLEKAQSILAIAQGFEAFNSGGSSASTLATLQTDFLAFVKTVSDPAVQLVMNGLFAAVLTEVQAFATGSLLGKINAMAANEFWSYVGTTAQAYVTELTAAAK